MRVGECVCVPGYVSVVCGVFVFVFEWKVSNEATVFCVILFACMCLCGCGCVCVCKGVCGYVWVWVCKETMVYVLMQVGECVNSSL